MFYSSWKISIPGDAHLMDIVFNIQVIECNSIQSSHPLCLSFSRIGAISVSVNITETSSRKLDFRIQNDCANVLEYTALLYQNFYF